MIKNPIKFILRPTDTHVTPVMLLLQQTISLTHSKLTQQKREDGGNLSPEIKQKVYS